MSANERDRKDQRAHTKSVLIYSLILGGVISVLLFFFLGFSLYIGKDNVALEIIKAIGYVTAGGFGGYGIAKKTNISSETK